MLDTVDNVKSRLNITTSEYDTFLTAQIGLISDTIEAYLRRKVLSTTFTQHFYRCDYQLSRMMQLFCYPIQSITSIMEDGVARDSSTYRTHKPTGRILTTDHSFFFYAEETIVTYVAGFTDVPSPILAVLDSVVQERYNKLSSGVDLNFGSNVQRVAIPGAISIDFDYSVHNDDRGSAFGVILGSNLNVLDPYRSERALLGTSKLEYIDEAPEENP